jgi:DNA-binding HxlR family transcriptional regulator
MTAGSYSQFCPVAMAAEVLCSRWTMLILRELVLGSSRFNELRRGVPRMSPALLSKRLKELEAAGIVARTRVPGEIDVFDYRLTPAGQELRPIVEGVGAWGQRWVATEATLSNLDPDLLMWDMRRNINTEPMPRGRSTIQFIYRDQSEGKRNWWLIVEPQNGVDLCHIDPGFDVDLYVATDLRTMTEVWLGYAPISRSIEDGRVSLTGSPNLASSLQHWLKLSTLAKVEKLVA